jgi:hypothetical protein
MNEQPPGRGDKEENLKKYAFLVLAVSVLVVGCPGSGSKESGIGDDGDVVAKVGEKAIYEKQVEQFLGNLPPQVSSRYGPNASAGRSSTDSSVWRCWHGKRGDAGSTSGRM